MSLRLKRTVKRNILDYKAYIRKQNVRDRASKRYSPTTVLKTREQAAKLTEKVNEKLNVIFEDLNVRSRQTALDILNNDEKLMNRFVKRDKFNLTFTQKFQMSRKRIRKLLKNSIVQSFEKQSTVKEMLDEVQRVWESSSEFTKFIAYMVADAFIFAEFEKIEDASQTGRFEIYLSDLHSHTDICNHRIGVFNFGDDVELPPFHPYCVCGVRAA